MAGLPKSHCFYQRHSTKVASVECLLKRLPKLTLLWQKQDTVLCTELSVNVPVYPTPSPSLYTQPHHEFCATEPHHDLPAVPAAEKSEAAAESPGGGLQLSLPVAVSFNPRLVGVGVLPSLLPADLLARSSTVSSV